MRFWPFRRHVDLAPRESSWAFRRLMQLAKADIANPKGEIKPVIWTRPHVFTVATPKRDRYFWHKRSA